MFQQYQHQYWYKSSDRYQYHYWYWYESQAGIGISISMPLLVEQKKNIIQDHGSYTLPNSMSLEFGDLFSNLGETDMSQRYLQFFGGVSFHSFVNISCYGTAFFKPLKTC